MKGANMVWEELLHVGSQDEEQKNWDEEQKKHLSLHESFVEFTINLNALIIIGS